MDKPPTLDDSIYFGVHNIADRPRQESVPSPRRFHTLPLDGFPAFDLYALVRPLVHSETDKPEDAVYATIKHLLIRVRLFHALFSSLSDDSER